MTLHYNTHLSAARHLDGEYYITLHCIALHYITHLSAARHLDGARARGRAAVVAARAVVDVAATKDEIPGPRRCNVTSCNIL